MEQILGINASTVYGVFSFALASAVVVLWYQLKDFQKKDKIHDEKEKDRAFEIAKEFTDSYKKTSDDFTKKIEEIHSNNFKQISSLHQSTVTSLSEHTAAIQEIKQYFEKKERLFDLIIKHIDRVEDLINKNQQAREAQMISLQSNKDETLFKFEEIVKKLLSLTESNNVKY